MNGIVYLTGAGPGDYRLLTLRGREVLERADVVIYDYLADPRLLEFAPPTAEKIYVGKKAADHTLSQDKIIDLLIAKAKEGKTYSYSLTVGKNEVRVASVMVNEWTGGSGLPNDGEALN